MQHTAPAAEQYAAFVSLDWADQQHAWALQPASGAAIEEGVLKNTPEAVETWALQLAERFGGQPVAVALEQQRGAVIAMLCKYAHLTLYPIHPSTLANYRKSFYPSGAKSDPRDTRLQLELLVRHRDRLTVLQPDTVETRKLRFLVEQRRKRVDEKTAYGHQLTSWLKQIFPQLLAWFDDPASPVLARLLERWPTLGDLQRARPATLRTWLKRHSRWGEEQIQQRLEQIEQAVEATRDRALLEAGVVSIHGLLPLLAQLRSAIACLDQEIRKTAAAHPDFTIICSFPGAGPAMAPRLLAALGTQRERFDSSGALQSFTGIAPVVVSSGQQHWVHWRWACPKFIRQTFHEWAQHTMKKSAWARDYYQHQRDQQKSHHAAIRALAFKWLRILYRCWQDHQPYNEARYLAALHQRSGNNHGMGIQWKSVAGFSKPS